MAEHTSVCPQHLCFHDEYFIFINPINTQEVQLGTCFCHVFLNNCMCEDFDDDGPPASINVIGVDSTDVAGADGVGDSSTDVVSNGVDVGSSLDCS